MFCGILRLERVRLESSTLVAAFCSLFCFYWYFVSLFVYFSSFFRQIKSLPVFLLRTHRRSNEKTNNSFSLFFVRNIPSSQSTEHSMHSETKMKISSSVCFIFTLFQSLAACYLFATCALDRIYRLYCFSPLYGSFVYVSMQSIASSNGKRTEKKIALLAGP